ncbi:MAG: adenylate/guanylate cyclase domain-containing protein [Nocardioidaceae bacterium]|nr:adenylate/guanylate cyclase domain-containing protein [Nocardioidaceae bacterium]
MFPSPRVGYAPRGDGAHIGYWTLGEGPPVISWPGGTITSMALFDEPRCAAMQRRFATFSTRISVDRRGMGYSDPLVPGEPPTLERQAGDLLCVLDALGIERASMWGNAWDAQGLMYLAATRPERVDKLVLSSTTPCPLARPDWPYGIPEHVLAALGSEYDHPGTGVGPQDLPELIFPSCSDDQDLLRWMDEGGRVSPATARAYTEMAAASDVRELLGSITAPTLLLHSTGDRWTPIGAARYMADAIPDARLVEYDSPDHMVFTTDLDAKLDEAARFLELPEIAHVQRRLLTVLFTDVVGSTERLAATADLPWTALLDEIDDTVAWQVRQHGGRVCKSMGDGHLALFERPSDAVAAAVAIGQRLRRAGVEIRAGAHIGEVELRGTDVAGVAVHVGARVSGKAGAGEVVITRTVADLLAGSPYRVEEAGEHELKGLPGTWPLFRVRPA